RGAAAGPRTLDPARPCRASGRHRAGGALPLLRGGEPRLRGGPGRRRRLTRGPLHAALRSRVDTGMSRVRLVISSPISDELVDRIRATDERLDVVHEPDLLAPARYAADHSLPTLDDAAAR